MKKSLLLLLLLTHPFLNAFFKDGLPTVQHELSLETKEFLKKLVERFEHTVNSNLHTVLEEFRNKADRIEEAFNKTEASFQKTDRNVDTLVGHLSPEQMARLVTQGGIALAASTTTVLSAYILYAIARYEFQKSVDDPGHTMSKKMKTFALISSFGLAGSIYILLKSGNIAQHYAALN